MSIYSLILCTKRLTNFAWCIFARVPFLKSDHYILGEPFVPSAPLA